MLEGHSEQVGDSLGSLESKLAELRVLVEVDTREARATTGQALSAIGEQLSGKLEEAEAQLQVGGTTYCQGSCVHGAA
jgi:hypothetical protein